MADDLNAKIAAWIAEDNVFAERLAKDSALAKDDLIRRRRQKLREACRIARIRIARDRVMERIKRTPDHPGLKARLAEYDAELAAVVE